MRQWADSGAFHGLRTRALTLLVWGSALRLSEALALDIGQVLQRVPTNPRTIGKVRGTAYLRPSQSKGGHAAGAFVITKAARDALRPYLLEGLRRGWIPVGDADAPLFVTARGGGHQRVRKRAAQYAWERLQQRAGIRELYRFHDLRHDAMTRVSNRAGGDMFKVAAFGRLRDIRTTATYVHSDPVALAHLAELADS